MKFVIAGGSGWLGSAITHSLRADGNTVVILSRSPRKSSSPGIRWVGWDGRLLGPWSAEIDGSDAIINLAGQSVAEGRWSAERKRALLTSRLEPTKALLFAIERAQSRPTVLVNASGVGYYGDTGDRDVDERDPPGSDFLARLVVQWEHAAIQAEALGMRVCLMRTGIVLGPGGGVLAKLSLPFRLFVGGHIGSGKQWVSWIHIDDVVGLYRFAVDCADASGPINVTSPCPVTNRQLSETIAAVMGRPSWIPVPGFALRLLLGELADQVLTGQRALPKVAEQLGYQFAFPTLEPALSQSLDRAA